MSFNEIHISAPSKLILHGEHAVVYGKTAVAASLDLRTRMVMKFPSSFLSKNGQNAPLSFDHHGEHGSSGHINELMYSGSSQALMASQMVTVNFPDVGIKESWNLDSIQHLLSKRPSLMDGCDMRCSKGCSPKDSYIGTNKTANESYLLEICNFLRTNKADLRMQSLVCFFYLYSQLCGPNAIPLNISIESDIPIGAGLGSSAALSVCLSAGLLTVLDVRESCSTCKNTSLQTNHARKEEISMERLKLICDFAYISEQIIHGRPSGIDNTASTYGGFIQFCDFKVVLPIKSSNDKSSKKSVPKIRILLVNTNIPRNTKIMVQKVTNLANENPDQLQETIEEIDHISKSFIDLLVDSCDIKMEENLLTKWGQLIDRNQHLLAKGLRVSHSKLDSVCEVAAKYGLHGKLTGAGGGGYAFIILPSVIQANILESMKTELIEMDCSVCETTLGASGGVKINVL